MKKISKINVSSYKLRPWFTKGDAPPSKTCKFDLINGEAHSNVSGFSDRTLAECYKSILPNFQNDTEPTMWGTIFHQADLSGGARRIDLGKSKLRPELNSFEEDSLAYCALDLGPQTTFSHHSSREAACYEIPFKFDFSWPVVAGTDSKVHTVNCN